MTYVMDGRVARMDSISPSDIPLVFLVLVDQSVPTLEVNGIRDLGVIFILDDLPRDLLLDDSLAPVLVEPRLLDLFLISVSVEQGVLKTADVEVDLEVNNVVVQRAHCDDYENLMQSEADKVGLLVVSRIAAP